jgi:ketosteroid isomerase-like protein
MSSNDDIHAELDALERHWSQAILADDAERIASFTTGDWVLVSDQGVTSREQFLSVIRSGQLTHSAMEAVGKSRVRVYGDTAVLTVRMLSTAHYGGGRQDGDEWTTDVWVRQHSRWLCALTHLTASATT